MSYKLWDNKEQTYLTNPNGTQIECDTVQDAEESKLDYLDAGNYPDDPHTVISICEHKDGRYIREVL